MSKIICLIPTYDRPYKLLNLLQDIYENKAKHNIRIHIVNDASNLDYSEVIEFLKSKFKNKVFYTKKGLNEGKHGFWKTINLLYQSLLLYDFDYVFGLNDDFRLKNNFFNDVISDWNNIKDNKKVCYNPMLLDRLRDNTLIRWSNSKITIKNFADFQVFKSNFVDTTFLAEKKYFELLDYHINPMTKHELKFASSGVGAQVTKRLIEKGYNLYMTTKTYIDHTCFDNSVMHNELRKRQNLTTNKNDQIDMNQFINDTVTIGIATMPGREKSLEQTLNSLLPQCDNLYVYFNNFNGKLPEYINELQSKYSHLTIYESEKEAKNLSFQQEGYEKGDLTDAGGFYKISDIKGYFISCDDDMVYPNDFVKTIVNAVKKYDNKIIAGFHGRIYQRHEKIKSYYHGHEKLIHVNISQAKDIWTHIVAGLGLCFHTDALKLSIEDFIYARMKDIFIAKAAQLQGVPRLVLAHDKAYIKQSPLYDQKKSICKEEHRSDEKQVELFNSVDDWIIQTYKTNNQKLKSSNTQNKNIPITYIKYRSTGTIQKTNRNRVLDAIRRNKVIEVSENEYLEFINNYHQQSNNK